MDIFHRIDAFYHQVYTEKRIIGYSLFHLPIYAVKIGQGRPTGIAQYAMHGREFITAALAMRHYAVGVRKGSVWIVPLVNPDGALLSEQGAISAPANRRKDLLRFNGGSKDFSLWKANGRGVDLNVNFDARWGTGLRNVFAPALENYVGESPFSEPETRALKAFTEVIEPDYTISYHTKGEEIYWRFFQEERDCARDRALAEILAKTTGYAVRETFGSVGGYKDWCIQTFRIPSFTVEVGQDAATHPLGEGAWADIDKKNAYALYRLSSALDEIR